MPRRLIAFVIVAVALAAIFVRLGLWQLDRRAERRAFNAHIATGLRAAPAPFADVVRAGSSARYRRVTLTGTPDYAHERVLGARTNGGSPGVHLLTPVRVAGSDTAVLVNRGWVYSADGANVDATRWRESATMTFIGWAETFATDAAPGTAPAMLPAAAGGPPILRRLDRDAASAGLPYPLAPMLLVATSASPLPADSAGLPVRLAPPALAEGPHLGYAIQWFAFAAIAVVGAGVVALKTRRVV